MTRTMMTLLLLLSLLVQSLLFLLPTCEAFFVVPSPTRTITHHYSSASFTTTCTRTTTRLCADTTDTTTSTTTNNNNDVIVVSLEDRLLKGVKTMNKVMTPEFFNEASPLLKTMYTTICKNVKIKPSTIEGAGMGLFAKKNIKSGTIVSFYPAHSLGIDTDEGASTFICLPNDQEYFQQNPATNSPYLHCTDQPLFQRPSILADVASSEQQAPPPPLYLDVNPNLPVVGGWTSHYINDGARVESNTEQGVLQYYKATGATKNCIHIPWGPSPIMATVTTRKVKKGQELFTTYGGIYWLNEFSAATGNDNDDVAITPAIQSQIQQTANDLRKSMQDVAIVYANQLQEMRLQFDKISAQQSNAS